MQNLNFTLSQGFIQIYCGEGKGKTTAALGLAIRHLGHGGRVLFCSFCKGYKSFFSGEKEFFKRLRLSNIKFKRFGNREKWEAPDNIDASDMEWAVRNWEYITKNSRNCTLLVIDEACAALKCGLIPEYTLLNFVKSKPQTLEIVLTGRDFPDKIKEQAGLISRIESEKHYFNTGVQAREGVEY